MPLHYECIQVGNKINGSLFCFILFYCCLFLVCLASHWRRWKRVKRQNVLQNKKISVLVSLCVGSSRKRLVDFSCPCGMLVLMCACVLMCECMYLQVCDARWLQGCDAQWVIFMSFILVYNDNVQLLQYDLYLAHLNHVSKF